MTNHFRVPGQNQHQKGPQRKGISCRPAALPKWLYQPSASLFFLCLLKSLLCKFNWDKIWALLGLPLLCLTPVSPYWRALKGWSAELTKKTRRWLSELMPLLWNWTSILQFYLTSALSIPVRWEEDTSTTTRSWMAALGQGRMLKEHGKFSSCNG